MGAKPVDIAVVGAGPAGLMAAIGAGRTAQARRVALNILLLDARPKIGAKILMSGGTRCNVTHQKVQTSDFQGGPSHFVRHVLQAFTPGETLRFFKEIGVELVLEPTGKYFPATHSAETVLDALTKETGRSGTALKTGVRITEINKTKGLFHLKNAEGTYRISAERVILTTGGLSYPATGSDGTGYGIAKSFGHTVVPTSPALTPLLTNDPDWKSLSGVSLEAEVSFFKKGRKECRCRGSFLFTHFGFSGPAALDISRHFARTAGGENPQIIVNFLPRYNEESFKTALQSAREKDSNPSLQNLLAGEFSLPARLVAALLKKIGPGGGRNRLIHLLFNYPLEVTGVFGYAKAEVTAGGVDLKEVAVSSMESKLAGGLYFAGEILDTDGRIGGFNFQWAWSTGTLAGRSAARSLFK